MIYRHRIYLETAPYERLGQLSAAVAAKMLRLAYQPKVHYFEESANGKFPRPHQATGFVDNCCSPCDFCIFVRRGMTASETARTVFHEASHIDLFGKNLSGAVAELRCTAFELRAPWGSLTTILRRLEALKPVWSGSEKLMREDARALREEYYEDEQRRKATHFTRAMDDLKNFRQIQREKAEEKEAEIRKALLEINRQRLARDERLAHTRIWG